jgi:hypothetical protein
MDSAASGVALWVRLRLGRVGIDKGKRGTLAAIAPSRRSPYISAMNLGRNIAIAFALFAVVALIASIDMARGRTPVTQSALVLDVLAGGADKQCRRDVSNVVARHVKPGMGAAEARAVIDAASITPPSPWFWKPSISRSDNITGSRIEAVRTLRATAFGNELLRMDVTLTEGKVTDVKAQVECAFR